MRSPVPHPWVLCSGSHSCHESLKMFSLIINDLDECWGWGSHVIGFCLCWADNQMCFMHGRKGNRWLACCRNRKCCKSAHPVMGMTVVWDCGCSWSPGRSIEMKTGSYLSVLQGAGGTAQPPSATFASSPLHSCYVSHKRRVWNINKQIFVSVLNKDAGRLVCMSLSYSPPPSGLQ